MWRKATSRLKSKSNLKRDSNHNKISAISDSPGNRHITYRNSNQQFSQFYFSLYTENMNFTSEEIEKFLNFIPIQHISEMEREI